MKLICKFDSVNWFGEINIDYSCFIVNQLIPENRQLEYTGRNKSGKARTDVKAIHFDKCKIAKIPQRMTEYFPKLETIFITNSNLKILTKSDLLEYRLCKNFTFDCNEIEYLPGNLFEGFPNLERISFYKNNLKVIEPNILDGLDKLKYVNFESNSQYNLIYSENPRFFSNQTIQSMKQTLKAKSIVKLEQGFGCNIQNVTKENQLKQEILSLKTHIENLKKSLAAEKSKKKIKTHLTTDLINFTQNETYKDFQILIDNREFPVHKFLLAARSPTLAEMFQKNPEAENLKLVDISVEIFEQILKFLYTDELPRMDVTDFLHLFIAAGRLRIKELKNYAATQIYKLINEENAIEILNLGIKYGHNELRQKAFNLIKRMYPKIDFKDDWIEDGDKLEKFIEAFKIKEEIIKKAEEDFKKLAFAD